MSFSSWKSIYRFVIEQIVSFLDILYYIHNDNKRDKAGELDKPIDYKPMWYINNISRQQQSIVFIDLKKESVRRKKVKCIYNI